MKITQLNMCTIKMVACLYFILIGDNVNAQNLVSNGSFEQIYCQPQNITVYRFCDWEQPPNNNATPDGFKDSSTGNCFPCNCNIGDNTFPGNTYALDGNYFVGGVGYYIQGGLVNARENIQTKLNMPLMEGHQYKIGFSVKLGSRSKYIIDHFGMYISDTAYVIPNNYPLFSVIPVIPQLDLSGPLYDSTNWTSLSTSYIAQGGEEYVTIGNFTLDSALNIINNPLYNPADSICLLLAYASYIFIDSVYIFDETATTVIDREQQQVMLYPSPASDKIFIKLKDESQIEAVTIYKMDGRLLQKQKYLDCIAISFLSQGIYLIEVKTDKGILRSTFLKE